MKTTATLLLAFALGTIPLFAKTHKPLTLASEIVATAKPATTDHSPKAMVAAAESFLKTLTPEQRKQFLLKLVYLWLDDMPKPAADARLKEVEAQLDQSSFAWHGPYKPGSDASYHLYGPGVIIEYAGQNLGGDPLDHLHSIYRDPTNEYGAKWIK